MKVLKYMFFGILLFIEVPLWADSMGYENVLKNVSLHNGFVNLSVSDFCMDADGQMWMSTSQGLFVYNGQYVQFARGVSSGFVLLSCRYQ